MSEWEKKEQPVSGGTPAIDESPEKAAVDADRLAEEGRVSEQTALPDIPAAPVPAAAASGSSRYTPGGRRRGRRRAAAPIGFIVLVLAVIGVVAIAVRVIGAIQRSMDNTALKDELALFIRPVINQLPPNFEDVNAQDIDELLEGTLWYLTHKETVRMAQEKTQISTKYVTDDMGRWEIPQAEVEEAYRRFFGPDAELRHRTLGGEEATMFDMEYDSKAGVYRTPLTSSELMYTPVFHTLKKKSKDFYTISVAYVPNANIPIDDQGEEIDPTPDMAEFTKQVAVKRSDSGEWMIVSISGAGGEDSTRNGSEPEPPHS